MEEVGGAADGVSDAPRLLASYIDVDLQLGLRGSDHLGRAVLSSVESLRGEVGGLLHAVGGGNASDGKAGEDGGGFDDGRHVAGCSCLWLETMCGEAAVLVYRRLCVYCVYKVWRMCERACDDRWKEIVKAQVSGIYLSITAQERLEGFSTLILAPKNRTCLSTDPLPPCPPPSPPRNVQRPQ